jgi:hypothetical protein
MCNMTEDAVHFGEGKWIYCKSHVRVHTTGWCTVPITEKVALNAETFGEAKAEAISMGFLINGN